MIVAFIVVPAKDGWQSRVARDSPVRVFGAAGRFENDVVVARVLVGPGDRGEVGPVRGRPSLNEGESIESDLGPESFHPAGGIEGARDAAESDQAHAERRADPREEATGRTTALMPETID